MISPRKPEEKSFTLIETVMALGLVVAIVLEVASVQGNAIHFTLWSRKATQASWLAQGIMAEIEYKSKFYPIKELRTEATMKDRNFSESLCPKGQAPECADMTYTVTIDEFKLPILDLMLGQKGDDSASDKKSEEGPGGAMGGMGSLIKDQVKNILGDEIMKIARVEVFWPEGATRDSVALSYLILNQQSLDNYIETMEPIKNTGSNGVDPAPPQPGPLVPSESGGAPIDSGVTEEGDSQ